MANNTGRMYTPKRRIERRQSKISDQIASTSSTLTLHTAEDRKTVVRTIVDLCISNTHATSAYDALLIMAVAPGGTAVVAAGLGQSLDDECKGQLLVNKYVKVMPGETYHWFVDLKSQRKLQTGDEIEMYHISNDAGADTDVTGFITHFFKE